jgi:hypothetical protein
LPGGRLELLGCLRTDEQAAAGGFRGGLRPGGSRMALVRWRRGLKSAPGTQ